MTKNFILVEGGKKLQGEINLSGAKNAALPMLVAACLGEEPTVLENVPISLRDVQVLIELLRKIGGDIKVTGNTVTAARGNLNGEKVPSDLVNKIRYSLLLLGAFAGLGEKVFLPMCGGCNIGDRKFDLHLLGLRKLGALVKETDEGIHISPSPLTGAEIEFYLPTTSGTENVMLAAVFAKQETVIKNANTRPEIQEFGKLLNAMGAEVEVRNRVVRINGAGTLKGGVTFTVMPGWDEAITYMIAAGVTGGEILIKNMNTYYIKTDAHYLRTAGLDIFEWGGSLYIKANPQLKPFDLFTTPYPGVNSDMQPLFAALALKAKGTSTITDMRFTERFAYTSELKKFGADIEVYGNCAVVKGGKNLIGTEVTATDLRGGATEILCGLFSKGTTRITNVYQIERGYEYIVDKFQAIGADIKYLIL